MNPDLDALRSEIERLREAAEGDYSLGTFEERFGMAKACDRLLSFLDGRQESPASSGLTTDDRLAALALDGWTLVHGRPEHTEPVPGEPEKSERVPGLYRLERVYRGRALSESGETLERALAAAEWQQARISELDDTPTPVHAGPLPGGARK